MNKIVALLMFIMDMIAFTCLILSGDLINCSMWLVVSFMTLIVASIWGIIYLIHLPNN